MNYENKIEEMRKELKKAEEIVSVIERIKSDMQWDTMKVTDEKDENGMIIFEAPTEDDWNYERYLAYNEIINLIENHYFK